MKIRVKNSIGVARPVDEELVGDTLPKPHDIISLNTPPFVGHFRVDEVEPPMTGDNPHRSLPLLYVHSMYREF